MNDPVPHPTQAQPESAPPARPSARRRRVRVLALTGAVALAAGATGAVAATVAHHGDGTASPSPAASIYIPYGGPQGASSRFTGGAAVDSVAAPMPQGATGVASSYGGAAAASMPSIYPYPAVCTGAQPAQVSGQVVTATGNATVPLGAVTPVYVLYAWVSSQTSSDAPHAVADVQHRLAAITDALVSAGVDRASIHASTVSVYAGGYKGVPVPATARPQTVQVTASASLRAELPGAGSVDKVVSAAASAGADSVNVSNQPPALSEPAADALNAAISLAADQAHQLAAAAAKATGVTLGAVRSVSTQQPTQCGWGIDGPELVFGVTVAYAIG